MEDEGRIDAGGKLTVDGRGGDGELVDEAGGAPDDDIDSGQVGQSIVIYSADDQSVLPVQCEVTDLRLYQIVSLKAGDIEHAGEIVQEERAVGGGRPADADIVPRDAYVQRIAR